MNPAEGPVFSWNAKRIEDFMQGVGISCADFIYQSHGGSCVIALAARRPDLISKMVVVSSQPIYGGVIAPIAMMTKRVKGIVDEHFHKDEGPTRDKMHRLIADLEYYEANRVTSLNVESRYQASLDPAMARLAATPGASGEWESLIGLFGRVTTPTLLVYGAYDWFGGPDVPLLMLNQFTDARLHVMGRAGHHLQTECPEEFNAHVKAFLDDGSGV